MQDFLTITDLMQMLGRSRSYCSQRIKNLNKELEKDGYITFRGRVLKSYFYKRIGREASL